MQSRGITITERNLIIDCYQIAAVTVVIGWFKLSQITKFVWLAFE